MSDADAASDVDAVSDVDALSDVDAVSDVGAVSGADVRSGAEASVGRSAPARPWPRSGASVPSPASSSLSSVMASSRSIGTTISFLCNVGHSEVLARAASTISEAWNTADTAVPRHMLWTNSAEACSITVCPLSIVCSGRAGPQSTSVAVPEGGRRWPPSASVILTYV
ncbi:MAG: hypothetical protein QF578_03660 [Alphaproteobacteria bacterium]|nr:hypothetical protein [Alphaproteobacteria bacterium]MDP6812384.1 hypothetical protein [Alphaproteobacteria bacterium]